MLNFNSDQQLSSDATIIWGVFWVFSTTFFSLCNVLDGLIIYWYIGADSRGWMNILIGRVLTSDSVKFCFRSKVGVF